MLSGVKEELAVYGKNYKEAAIFYRVSERTIRRWMKSLKIYLPKEGYYPGKLDMITAQKIRDLYNTDKYTQTELAKRFKVSQGTIGKIINNLIYRADLMIGGSAEAKIC